MQPWFGSVFVFLIAATATRGADVQELQQTYNYHAVLDSEGKYTLYWNFDLEQETITFAVRVQTSGWVGFGLSPNGQMPNSDVVIGWVVGDQGYFHDRFADYRSTPPVDQQQDWRLLEAEEQDGYTTLEFTRKLITCDSRDLDITPETARVIWSYYNSDPPSSDPSQTLDPHDQKGTRSLNLLGGPRSTFEEPENITSFNITSEEVLIPNDSDTTYWCTVRPLPSVSQEQEIFLYRTSPIITEGNEDYVHHFLVYLCPPGQVVTTGDCRNLTESAQECRGATLIGAWAVGGEEFVYPEGVALPLGGPMFASEHILIEVHYNNPMLVGGIVDSSGLEFFYTTKEPEHRAGVLFMGVAVSPVLLIPPGQDQFAVTAECSFDCLDRYLPDEGITIFASQLHTHLQGVGVTLRHYTSTNECGATEELEPIDKNLQYDFNYQDIIHLTRKPQIKKGDSLQLECIYQSSNKDSVTLGGLGTNDEMCLTFSFYYPQIELGNCVSVPQYHNTYGDFFGDILNINQTLRDLLVQAFDTGNVGIINYAMSFINWTPETVAEFNQIINDADKYEFCYPSAARNTSDGLPNEYARTTVTPDCSYEAPNQCTGYQPQSCCDSLRQVTEPSPTPGVDGVGALVVSVSTIALLLLAISMLV